VSRLVWFQQLGAREAAARFGTSLGADVWFGTAIKILSEGSVLASHPGATTRENGS